MDERRRVRVKTVSVNVFNGWPKEGLFYDTQPGERVLSAEYKVLDGNRRELRLVVEGPIPGGDRSERE